MSGTSGPGTFSIVQDSWTKQNYERVLFRWSIENFSLLDYPTSKSIKSLDFSSSEHKWGLKVYPNGIREVDKDYLSVFISLRNEADVKVKAKYKVLILGPNNNETLFSMGPKIHNFEHSGTGVPKLVKRSDLMDESKGYLRDDKLKLGLELTIIKEIEAGSADHHEVLTVQCADYDYSEFMNSEKLSDVEIVSKDGKTFKAHKLILAKKSEVLAATLKHQLKETVESRVTVDISSEVLTQILKFMYSAKLDEGTKNNIKLLSELLAAADLYEIAQLKTTCGTLLLEKKTSKNVLSLFELGETYRCTKLKEGALELIVKNEVSLLRTKEWNELKRRNPHLAISIFEALRKAKSKRKATGKSSTKGKAKKRKVK